MNKGTLIIHNRNKRQAIVVSDKPYAKFYQEWNPHGWGDYGSAEMAVRIKYVDCGYEQVVKVASIKSNFQVSKPATTPARTFGSAVDTDGRNIEWLHE